MRRIALLLLPLLLVGCTKAPPTPTPGPSPKPEPVTLSIEPVTAAPGQQVTLRIKASSDLVTVPGKGYVASLCWGDCNTRSTVQLQKGTDGTWAGQTNVRYTIGGGPAQDGRYTLGIGCLMDVGQDCQNRPEASASLMVKGARPAIAWADLQGQGWAPVPSLVRYGIVAKAGERTVECVMGGDGQPTKEPYLKVTESGVVRQIALSSQLLGQAHGLSGCRSVAIDPHAAQSFYVAGGGHMAANGADAYPYAQMTTNGGQSWTRVLAPEGFGQPEQFLGFEVTAAGVTAWYGRQASQSAILEVIGQQTKDGGRSWAPVAFGCPSVGPCRWASPPELAPRLGAEIIQPTPDGKSWTWVGLGGQSLSFYPATLSWQGEQLFGVQICAAANSDCWPVIHSGDGGKSWQSVALPLPPSPDGMAMLGSAVMASDGSLQIGSGSERYRLAPGAQGWVQG